MHNILITKAVAYALTNSGDAINMNNLTDLAHGAIVIVADHKKVVNNADDAVGVDSFKFIVGITPNKDKGISVQNSVSIFPRLVNKINIEKYNEPVTQIVEIGPFPKATVDAEGEIGLTLSNDSFVGTIKTDSVRVNQWKPAGVSVQVTLQKIVDYINTGVGVPTRVRNLPFMTAALIGTDLATWKIRLTMKSEHVKFSSSSYGLSEAAPFITTRKAVLSKGKGSDVRRAEDEYSGNLGNAGYGWRNELYYGKPLEADGAGKYDIITINFMGEHDTAQNKVMAASNWLSIAVPMGAGVLNVLASIFPTLVPSYNPANDEANETDGNPAGPSVEPV